MAARSDPPCPLCARHQSAEFLTDKGRVFYSCATCRLIYLDPAQRLSAADEAERYRQHNNDPEDARYIQFLRRLADPLLPLLPPAARGLDFGCGPARAMQQIFADSGHHMVSYDPLFFPDSAPLNNKYDFITCSEVAEHLHQPGEVFRKLGQLLRPGGHLAVMTRFHSVTESFEKWWYRRDPTHVCFYDEATLRWVARQHDWLVTFPVPNVAIFQTPQAAAI